MIKPKCIDLFSGCGGFTLGMANAGYDIVGHVEWNDDCLETYECNKYRCGFPNSELIGKDITKITDEEILKFKEKQGNIDIIVGSPPCQGFSMAGKREIGDPRDNLFLHYVRFVNLINPKFFIVENVPGILSKKNLDGEIMINVIIRAFKEIGYNARYALCNCANYKVPQRRRRIIIVGSKEERNIRFPLPTNLGEKEGTEEVDGDYMKHDYKKCSVCKKYYASFVYKNLEKKEVVCMFCFEHERDDLFLSPCSLKEKCVVLKKDNPIPAKPGDFMMIDHIERRTSLKGTSNFICCSKDSEIYGIWKSSKEIRKVSKNKIECENAYSFILSKIIADPINKQLEELENI